MSVDHPELLKLLLEISTRAAESTTAAAGAVKGAESRLATLEQGMQASTKERNEHHARVLESLATMRAEMVAMQGVIAAQTSVIKTLMDKDLAKHESVTEAVRSAFNPQTLLIIASVFGGILGQNLLKYLPAGVSP